jgi:hypothetical protein
MEMFSQNDVVFSKTKSKHVNIEYTAMEMIFILIPVGHINILVTKKTAC